MPFELHELSHHSEFPALIDGLWRGYAEPFNAFWEILKGPSQEECVERYQTWNKADPTGHWLYVTDSETKKPWVQCNGIFLKPIHTATVRHRFQRLGGLRV